MPFHTRSVGAAFAILTLTAAAVACSGSRDDADDTGSVASDDSTLVGAAFLVGSDLHFGFVPHQPISVEQTAVDPDSVDVDLEEPDDEDDSEDAASTPADIGTKVLHLNEQMAKAMSSLTPALATADVKKAFAGLGMSNAFRGAVMTGDVTDDGQYYQWQQFVDTYGLTGTDALLNLKVFEAAGNHDYPWSRSDADYTKPTQDYVVKKITERTEGTEASGIQRANVVAHDAGGAYAVKWNNVLVINLGVKASDRSGTLIENPDPDPQRKGKFLYRNTNPFSSLDFLSGVLDDKKLNPSGTRVVLSFHYPIKTSNDRMTDGERAALYNVIKGHRIVAILHGHRHVSSRYKWCKIPVFEVDTPRSAIYDGYDSSFLAVDLDATRVKATTIRWRARASQVPEVGVDDNKSCKLKKAPSDTCWTAEENYADIPVQNGCDDVNSVQPWN